MPIITVSKTEIENTLSKSIDLESFGELLTDYMKGSIEKVEGDEIFIKFEDTNRAELWSSEGVARELRAILRLQKGMTNYTLHGSELKVTVDSDKVHGIRPEIACAVVKNIKFDDASIKSLMHIQDKLDTNYGRKRKKTSIGIYDFNRIKFPVIYTTVHPDSHKFIPLGMTKAMTPREILKEHPKGIEYSHILEKHKEYPILMDSENNTLSFPPIINSNFSGRVDATTTDVFIEVTGTDKIAVSNILSIMTSILAERGGKIYSLSMFDKATKNSEITPDFLPLEFDIKISYIRKRSGVNMDADTIRNCLEKMSYEVIQIDQKNDTIRVHAPFYRKDIMHQADIVEDIIIGYGYNNIDPKMPQIQTVGMVQDSTKREDVIKDIMIGCQCQEISSFILSSKELVVDRCKTNEHELVELENPVSLNWNVLRPSLLPVMLNFLALNKTIEFPQKIFEIGDVFRKDASIDTGVSQKKNLSVAITYNKANYNDIKSVLDQLASDLGLEFKIVDCEDSMFIPGRCGNVVLGKEYIGIIGEIHPETLHTMGLEKPVAIFEINIENLY